jgi:filamentous hemagglutinin family protein
MMKLQSASKLHRRVAKLRPVLLALISAGCVSAALAGPLPENVTRKAGDADVLTNGNTMTITQRSSRAAFESTNFSIDVGNTVAVNGPAGSLTLMRVIGNGSGGQSSQINGSLLAQNTFMLINPYGIYVGGTAVLQAANLMLSTKDMSPDLIGQDGSYAGFMSNAHLVFNTNASSYGDSTIDISPGAKLTATGKDGSIYLVADNVRNRGTIVAANAGKVGLLAVPSAEFDVEANVGDSGFITLTNYANFNYGLSQQEQDYTYRSAVNTGTIDAPNGVVTLVGVGNTGEGPRFDASAADAPLFSSGYDGQYRHHHGPWWQDQADRPRPQQPCRSHRHLGRQCQGRHRLDGRQHQHDGRNGSRRLVWCGARPTPR